MPGVLARTFRLLVSAISLIHTITAQRSAAVYSIADQPRCYLDNIVEYK